MKIPWNKGLKMSQATKDRISASRKGITAWNKGKSWSPETIEKISNSRKGKVAWNKDRKWSKLVKEKIRRTKLAETIEVKPFYERNQTSKRLRFEVLKRDNFKCQYCGRTKDETKLELDHKIPRSRGGENTLNNLITACIDCNRGKSNHF